VVFFPFQKTARHWGSASQPSHRHLYGFSQCRTWRRFDTTAPFVKRGAASCRNSTFFSGPEMTRNFRDLPAEKNHEKPEEFPYCTHSPSETDNGNALMVDHQMQVWGKGNSGRMPRHSSGNAWTWARVVEFPWTSANGYPMGIGGFAMEQSSCLPSGNLT